MTTNPVAEVIFGLLSYAGIVLALWLLLKYFRSHPCEYCELQPKGSMCPKHGIVK